MLVLTKKALYVSDPSYPKGHVSHYEPAWVFKIIGRGLFLSLTTSQVCLMGTQDRAFSVAAPTLGFPPTGHQIPIFAVLPQAGEDLPAQESFP